MKKVSIFLLFFLFPFVLMSQGLGIRGGYSLSAWNGFVLASSDFENEALGGFHLGVYGSIKLNESFFLEPGAFYSAKGAQGSVIIDSDEITVRNKSAYLDAPLLVRLHVNQFNFAIGPQLSLKMKNEVEVEIMDLNNGTNISSTEDTGDLFQDTDAAIVLALGYQFHNGLNINASYDLGLTNVLVDEDALPGGNYYTWLEAKHRVLKISLGVTFY